MHAPPSTRLARSIPTTAPGVLFAIGALEHSLFLPDLPPSLELRQTDPKCFGSPSAWHELLIETGPAALVTGWGTPSLPSDWLARDDCPLRYVCHLAGSVRRLVPRVFLERGGLVTNWSGLAAPQVAEHTLLLTLASLRDLASWLGEHGPAAGVNIQTARTRTLFGRRVGVHGCGGVARHLARLLAPFGCDIACWSRGVPEAVIRAAGMTPAASIEDLFTGRDVLIECEALVPGDEGWIDRNLLSRLPNGALFVNVGRGRIMDEPALLAEALSGRLRVALDVLVAEPPPPGSPWWAIPGAILSPHIAGPTRDMMPRIGDRAMDNLERFLAGRPLVEPISLELYDRAT